MLAPAAQAVRIVGRYALYSAIAAGGMATVHLGRLLGPVGFSRTVAIKRLHAQFAADPEFVSMFLDEARLAARIRHPNVVPTLDVVATGGELFLVMDYVPGESVSRLFRAMCDRQETIPLRITATIMTGLLHGLHAAHEARDERGHPLGIVHRDVSPQNVLVGTDGVPRVLDFGVAKAAGRMQTTKEGQIKGKLAYMPPEQLRGSLVSRQTDIYAAGVMLWELLTGLRLFAADNEGAIVAKVLEGHVERPSRVLSRGRGAQAYAALRQVEAVDEIVRRAVAMDAEARYGTAREMALELERALPLATASEVGDWVDHVARDVLHSRAAMIAEIESSASAMPANGDHVMSVLQSRETHAPWSKDEPTRQMDHTSQQTRTEYVAVVDGPPVTQPSSISVSSPRYEGGARRTSAGVAAGILVGLSLVAAAVIWRYAPGLRHSSQATTASAAHHPSATPPQTPTAPEAAPSSATARVEPARVDNAGVEPSTSSSTPLAAAGASAVKGRKGGGASIRPQAPPTVKPQPQPVAPAPGSPDCSTPFWFDAQQVKHYKPECVK